MQTFFIIASVLADFSFATVASLGSSYAAGAGTIPYGSLLADLLSVDFLNLAQGGSNLTAVPTQAQGLAGEEYDAVVMTTGGNDLNYVGCLSSSATDSWCGKTIDQSTFQTRFTSALDAIISNVNDETPIYVVQYPVALGADTKCSENNTANCTMTTSQVMTMNVVYTKIISWTSSAVTAWKLANPVYAENVMVIPMNIYSQSHDVGAQVNWINGKTDYASTNQGSSWHETPAGHAFMAQAVYNNLNNLPVPPF